MGGENKFAKKINKETRLERSVENKKIVWFAGSNRYVVLEIPAYQVLSKLEEGETPDETANWCSKFYDLPQNEAERFVKEMELFVAQHSSREEPDQITKTQIPNGQYNPVFASRKYYHINSTIFSVEYENLQTESMLHPKFGHLEIFPDDHRYDHLFQVFQSSGKYVLRVNGETIGQWTTEDAHFFTGKFSMELLNRMYSMTEPGWMAVFHASAIRKGDGCVMFLGDSGSGKSTASALLMANGFHLLADDFVPVDVATGEVFFFPAAVSVKKNAFDHLIPYFPQLAMAGEHYYPEMGKTVRYIPPLNSLENHTQSCPCKALIFIKYQENSDLLCSKLAKDIAFRKLVPDSWISPIAGNASLFLDWFQEIPCYQLTYSDNGKMILAIEKIFQDEL